MVCAKCIKGAVTCPGKTTVKQYDRFSSKGAIAKSDGSSKDFNFKKRPSAFGCSLKFYKYRYFPAICRELPVEIVDTPQMKTRINITGGLHPYLSESAILLD